MVTVVYNAIREKITEPKRLYFIHFAYYLRPLKMAKTLSNLDQDFTVNGAFETNKETIF